MHYAEISDVSLDNLYNLDRIEAAFSAGYPQGWIPERSYFDPHLAAQHIQLELESRGIHMEESTIYKKIVQGVFPHPFPEVMPILRRHARNPRIFTSVITAGHQGAQDEKAHALGLTPSQHAHPNGLFDPYNPDRFTLFAAPDKTPLYPRMVDRFRERGATVITILDNAPYALHGAYKALGYPSNSSVIFFHVARGGSNETPPFAHQIPSLTPYDDFINRLLSAGHIVGQGIDFDDTIADQSVTEIMRQHAVSEAYLRPHRSPHRLPISLSQTPR